MYIYIYIYLCVRNNGNVKFGFKMENKQYETKKETPPDSLELVFLWVKKSKSSCKKNKLKRAERYRGCDMDHYALDNTSKQSFSLQ